MNRPHRESVFAQNHSAECRCACGSLVARLVADGVELKCRRCKRTLIVPLTPPSTTAPVRAVAPQMEAEPAG